MTPELQILLGSIVGGTGALLSYWAGWRARGRAQRAIDTSARVRRADAELYTKFFDPSLGVRWVEGHTQRGNGSGGPTTPNPDAIPRRNPFVSDFQQQINDQLRRNATPPRKP
jgi:hypothetical protein